MRVARALYLVAVPLTVAACASAPRAGDPLGVTASRPLAQVYYWRAKAGKLEAYTTYIRDFAEKVDEEARRAGAFLSVTTYVSRDTTSPWTHMRVFILRDSAQLAGLGTALERAGMVIEPDSVKRRVRGEYSATLRDRVGSTVLEVLR